MARPTARFRYGPTLDSYVDVIYPLVFDAVLCWREPAPNSDRVRNDAGTTDGWVTAYDFKMTGNLRWITPQNWYPGGLGVQGFIDWVAAGQAFRFVPDNTNENFYVDNCYVDDPFIGWKPTFEASNDSQAVPFTIRNSAFPFDWALRGVAFEYLPGTNITDWLIGTFGRGSTASYVNRAGLLVSNSIAITALRDAHYENGVRTTLIENVGNTNLLLQSEQFSVSPWTVDAGCTVTLGFKTGPDGALSGGRLNFTTTSTNNDIRQTATVANPASHHFTFSMWVADAGLAYNSDNYLIQMRRGDGTQNVSFTKGGGGIKLGTETLTIRQTGGGADVVYRRLYCTYVADATTNANVMVVFGSNGVTGDCYAFGAQLEDTTATADVPSSYMKTTTSTFTRAGETFNFPYTPVPQAMWMYAKFTEKGTVQYGNSQFSRIAQIGKTDNSNPKLLLYKDSASPFYAFRKTDGGGNVAAVVANVTPNLGDTVELLGILQANGSVQLIQCVNGGAEVATSVFVSNVMISPWSANVISFADVQGGMTGYQVLRVGIGSKVTSIAQARVA